MNGNSNPTESIARQTMPYPVFVYGTLMKGQRAAHMLDHCVYVGKFQLKDYGMYHLGRYPGIKPRKGENVFGEVYFVDEETRQMLDAYEEVGVLYDRAAVRVSAEGLTMDAEVYVYRGEVSENSLIRRAWNAQDSDPNPHP